MFNKKFSVVALIISSVLCSFITIEVSSVWNKNRATNSQTSQLLENQSNLSCETVAHRLDGYKFIKPLLYNSQTCESERYNDLKSKVTDEINKYQQEGMLDKASVFFKNFTTREYMGVNENDLFHPASLTKLPIMIAYLKMEEEKPGILNKKLVYHLPKGGVPPQTYNSKQILPEKSYSIKELLKYMIEYSDNNATYLLCANVDIEVFKKMFSDFGINLPDVKDPNFQISARDYSIFLNIVYNSGYLTIPDSEFVAELLSKCDFKQGIQSGIPGNCKLIHKFGEWGSNTDPNLHQLSESAIIYIDDSAYLLTIMTQGKSVKDLPKVLANISNIIYDYQKNKNI